ncbi:MAG: hypothetical protein RR757_01845 [Raoultibacter sp.]
MYLKWEDETVGIVDDSNGVHLIKPDYNNAVRAIFNGEEFLSPQTWQNFLEDRIVSRQRRDINKILFYFGLSAYDVFALAAQTRAISAKDKLWLATSEDERYAAVAQKQLAHAFGATAFTNNDTSPSPSGVNIKRYGIYQEHFGIIKQRLYPTSGDVESEIAVPLLARAMGIACCPAFRVSAQEVFSEFEYDWRVENIIHFSSIMSGGQRQENEVAGILAQRPQYRRDLFKMLVLDFVTRQDDRHLSNFAVKIGTGTETFYPLYDNGRSLFYEDTPYFVEKAVADPLLYATTFGPVGTYWEHIQDMLAADASLMAEVNLAIAPLSIEAFLKEAGFEGYRLAGAQAWIEKTLALLATF